MQLNLEFSENKNCLSQGNDNSFSFNIASPLRHEIEFDELENFIRTNILNRFKINESELNLNYENLLRNISKSNSYGQSEHRYIIKQLGILNRIFLNNSGTILDKSLHEKLSYDINLQSAFRFGNVELRALYSYLFESESNLYNSFEKFWVNRNNADYLYSENTTRDNWLSSSDAEFNIKKLATNAGFYPSESLDVAWQDFISFCHSYKQAIIQSNSLLSQSEFYPYFFRQANEFFQKDSWKIKIMEAPNLRAFYDSLAGKKVLFLTPFSEQINSIYKSGDIYRLFKNFNVSEFYLKAVPSAISTFPNRPHESFGNTSNLLISSIKRELDNNEYDIFISSCGAYGAEVTNFVRTHYSMGVCYQGNMTNTFFGIKQKSNEKFMIDRKNLDHWRKSDLSSFTSMSRIDGGRYV